MGIERDKTYSPLSLKNITLDNRIIRAATLESMADGNGLPGDLFTQMYLKLAAGGCKTIITGFNHTSKEGRAMQLRQAGIDTQAKSEAWKKIIDTVKSAYSDTKIIIQISHTGRQTSSRVTGYPVKGAGPVKCTYFRSRVFPLTTEEAKAKVAEYANAAIFAEKAGFDAVQVHAAHGYLIHQFLSPFTNNRHDCYGQDRLLFLKQVVEEIKAKTNLPIFLKISAADDRQRGLNLDLVKSYWPEIDALEVDAIEISYGMMEVAFNIIRGDHPLKPVLKHNMLFNKYSPLMLWLFEKFVFHWYKRSFKKYNDLYNLDNARQIKQISKTPIFVTGGIREKEQIERIINHDGLDAVTMSRPFIIEPDFINRLKTESAPKSECTSCNYCTVMCDSGQPLRCYRKTN